MAAKVDAAAEEIELAEARRAQLTDESAQLLHRGAVFEIAVRASELVVFGDVKHD